jgi:hypothetical protein
LTIACAADVARGRDLRPEARAGASTKGTLPSVIVAPLVNSRASPGATTMPSRLSGFSSLDACETSRNRGFLRAIHPCVWKNHIYISTSSRQQQQQQQQKKKKKKKKSTEP